MIDELIENIDSYLLLNQLGDMTDRLTLDYIKMSVNIYKEQRHEAKTKERRHISSNRAYTKS